MQVLGATVNFASEHGSAHRSTIHSTYVQQSTYYVHTVVVCFRVYRFGYQESPWTTNSRGTYSCYHYVLCRLRTYLHPICILSASHLHRTLAFHSRSAYLPTMYLHHYLTGIYTQHDPHPPASIATSSTYGIGIGTGLGSGLGVDVDIDFDVAIHVEIRLGLGSVRFGRGNGRERRVQEG